MNVDVEYIRGRFVKPWPGSSSVELLFDQSELDPCYLLLSTRGFFFLARSGRMTPEKTKKNVNGRKEWDYELQNYRRRNLLFIFSRMFFWRSDKISYRKRERSQRAAHTESLRENVQRSKHEMSEELVAYLNAHGLVLTTFNNRKFDNRNLAG